MESWEFKLLVSRVIRTSQESGLSNVSICIELLEQVRLLSCKEQLDIVSKSIVEKAT